VIAPIEFLAHHTLIVTQRRWRERCGWVGVGVCSVHRVVSAMHAAVRRAVVGLGRRNAPLAHTHNLHVAGGSTGGGRVGVSVSGAARPLTTTTAGNDVARGVLRGAQQVRVCACCVFVYCVLLLLLVVVMVCFSVVRWVGVWGCLWCCEVYTCGCVYLFWGGRQLIYICVFVSPLFLHVACIYIYVCVYLLCFCM